ncbi:MAG TPA: serine/threonine-protein kinase [Pyrinomonadaceae bacterium]|nr:serine/threonine-protein kinase [Pyrinomonadaceae bacterium]
MEQESFNEAETKKKEDSPSDSATLVGRETLVGTLLDGRYSIKRKLGEGGFGAVYFATDEKMMSRPVVAKILHVEKITHDWTVKKFRQEAEALARIDHPGVVGVLDSGQLPDGMPYIIMQYVDGVSLRPLIPVEGMDFARAANIVRQIGKALSAAHERGILHRDLKPENIMVQQMAGGDEQVKVIDFGVAKVKNSVVTSSEFGVTAGTAAYMSPEQLSAKPLTPASDVYSFGVIAYEILTGRRPVNPDSAYQLLELQRSGVRIRPSDLRPNVTEAAEAIILKALSFEPGERYDRAHEFGDLLGAALLGDTAKIKRPLPLPAADHRRDPGRSWATTESVTDVMRKPHRRAPVMAAAALAIVALAIAGAWYGLKSKATPVSPPPKPEASAPVGPEQSLTYWLTVQKMLNNRPLGKPIDSAGNIIFGNGWKFRFNVRPLQSGAMYLLGVGPGKNGRTEYNILFPVPPEKETGTQNASPLDARLQANQRMQSDWLHFDEHTGNEQLWIIWSARPLPELDKIFSEAAGDKQNPGLIVDAKQIAQIEIYKKLYDPRRLEKVDQPADNLTSIKGWGEVVVILVDLKHEEL